MSLSLPHLTRPGGMGLGCSTVTVTTAPPDSGSPPSQALCPAHFPGPQAQFLLPSTPDRCPRGGQTPPVPYSFPTQPPTSPGRDKAVLEGRCCCDLEGEGPPPPTELAPNTLDPEVFPPPLPRRESEERVPMSVRMRICTRSHPRVCVYPLFCVGTFTGTKYMCGHALTRMCEPCGCGHMWAHSVCV